MSDGRVPLIFTSDAAGAVARTARTALVLTRGGVAAGGAATLRHADAAARAQAGACACCRVPSDLVSVLRRLIIDRARGSADFAAVVVDCEPAAIDRLVREAGEDPFIAARCAVRGAPHEEGPP